MDEAGDDGSVRGLNLSRMVGMHIIDKLDEMTPDDSVTMAKTANLIHAVKHTLEQ